jgi:thiamine biosynthesis lipoprotein
MTSRLKNRYGRAALLRSRGNFQPCEKAAEHRRPTGCFIRRCRPLLGTFVEITAAGADESCLHTAINAAFAVIEKIQKLMSAHDTGSELSRLNREAAARPVAVSRELFLVLRRADRLAAESGGAFDPTIAPVLARWGFLPRRLHPNSDRAGSPLPAARNSNGAHGVARPTRAGKQFGDWRDVRLLPGRKVRFLQPLALDLGGIAKGFAVDRAIERLRKHCLSAAMVNAGGDLRAFGARSSAVHLRHPANPQTFADKIPVCNAALATSSPCFTERTWRGRRVSHLVDTLRQTAVTGAISVSVRAKECWLADALTKVVLNAPQLARKLLARHHAEAFVLTI